MNYIGIDLGGTNIKGALVSAEGEILKEHSIPTRVDLGPEAVAGRIGQVIAQLSIGEDTVGGVGVGCPGTVDDASGIVRFAANLNFVNFDLRSALRAHTALPIYLGNDANAAALGEALFGCGRGAESTIVVTLGTGVGGGIIIDGKVYTAATVGTVLPGVTRRSCIELLKDWGYEVVEGKIAIADIMAAAREGKLEEVFGTGTAAVVSPVKELVWKGEHAYIGDGKIGPVTQKLYDTMTGMQWGKIPDTKGWIVPVEKKY